MKKLPSDSVGRFARVKFDDVGAQDGIITRLYDDRKCFVWLGLCDRDTQSVDASQVVSIGNHVSAVNTGL